MAITNSNKKDSKITRGGYSGIGNSMNAFDPQETSSKRHQEELEKIKAERDKMAAELSAARRKEKQKVKLQAYVDEDVNRAIEENAKTFSRKDGGKSAYVNHIIRTALELDK